MDWKLLSSSFASVINRAFFVDEYWAYFVHSDIKDIEFGYKIHISAISSNITNIFDKVGDFLINNKISFKVINGFEKLFELNSGKLGFKQIGKAFTIYPTSISMFVEIIEILHMNTIEFSGPTVITDKKYKNSNCIYYRYGEFKKTNLDKRIYPIIKGCPIVIDELPTYVQLPQNVFLIKNLRIRGKSRIDIAIDIKNKIMEIVKTGFFLGEYTGYNIDGSSLIYNEYINLKKIQHLNCIPKIIDCFYIKNDITLILEKVKGVSLKDLLLGNKIDLFSVEEIMNSIFNNIELIHSCGICINDLSADNIIINREQIIFIDFEYAYSVNENRLLNHNFEIGPSTPGFNDFNLKGFQKDNYAVLKIFYYIIYPEEYKLVVNNQNDIQGIENFINSKIKVSELGDLNYIKSLYQYKMKKIKGGKENDRN